MKNVPELLKRLNLQHPIIQAPMVGVSTPALAAAVSNAGALGSIGIGASTTQQAQAMIAATRTLTARPVNVNLFCHRPAQPDPAREAAWLAHLAPQFAEFKATPPATLKQGYRSFLESDDTLHMLLQEKPAVLSFHFGLPPAAWIHTMKQAGIATLACITTPAEAQQAEQAGVDALIAQGAEAGGHRGCFDPDHDPLIGILALIPLIARASRLPIIAAGGIMDGKGIKAAMQLGAAAAQLGTAFVLCPESSASPAYRAALQGPLAHHTQITAAISGRPARGLANGLYTRLAAQPQPALPGYPATYDAAKALIAAAAANGNDDVAVQWAGQGAPLARAMPAADLVRVLMEDLAA